MIKRLIVALVSLVLATGGFAVAASPAQACTILPSNPRSCI